MFDKRKQFEPIEEMLNEVRIACNRAMIPFIWVAAVGDDGKQTDYRVAIDENQDKEPFDPKKYACHALVPGSMGVTLNDDKIKDIIKVLNGFKVVAKDTPITINPEEFSYSNMFPENKMYQYDEEEQAYVMPVSQSDVTSTETQEEERISLSIDASGVLPCIEEDF